MTWDDVLIKVVLIIVSAVGPLVTAMVAVGIKKLNSKIADDKLKNYTEMLAEIVDAVVGHAQQTVVEDIKEKAADGKLTLDEAKQIKQDVVQKVNDMLPETVYNFLESAEVDVNSLIDSLIESAVYATKKTPTK